MCRGRADCCARLLESGMSIDIELTLHTGSSLMDSRFTGLGLPRSPRRACPAHWSASDTAHRSEERCLSFILYLLGVYQRTRSRASISGSSHGATRLSAPAEAVAACGGFPDVKVRGQISLSYSAWVPIQYHTIVVSLRMPKAR